MKATKLFLLATLLMVAINSQAQVSVKVNAPKPPVWATAAPAKVNYYYLPDIQTYYDVPAQRYIYMRNGSWFRSAALPAHYRGYDLKHGNTVYLTDYRGNRPYEFYKVHKVKYKGKSWKSNGHDNGNRGNNEGRGNSEGRKKAEGHGNGNGHGNGHGKGKGKK